jgi:cytochrome c oxidase subunit IV
MGAHAEGHAHHGIGLYVKIYVALLVLLVLTVLAAKLHLPGYGPILLAMAIATVKAVLIVLYFMHMKSAGRLVALMFLMSLYVLGIGAVLGFADYFYR